MTDSTEYFFEDYLAAFMVVLGAQVQRKGIFLAEEGAFRAMADNTHGSAVAAAQRIALERQKHAIRQKDKDTRADRSAPVKLVKDGNP